MLEFPPAVATPARGPVPISKSWRKTVDERCGNFKFITKTPSHQETFTDSSFDVLGALVMRTVIVKPSTKGAKQ
jgi:hypothetical protein